MAKRIKRVFSNHSQVTHLWANQSQDSARCRNVYFKRTDIFSYGSHYLLGRIVKYKGITVALVNDMGWSPTTNKHIHSAWHAVEHLPRLKVASTDLSVSQIRPAMLRRQGELIDRCFNHFQQLSFWRESKWDEYDREPIAEFNKLCDTLGFKDLKLEVDANFIGLFNDHIKARVARQDEMNSPEAQAKKQELKMKRLESAILNWRQGGPLTRDIQALQRQLLRIKDSIVETSRGAEVPLTHAKRLLKFVEKGIAKPGEPVGNFKLSYIDDKYQIVKIGCHTIDLSEAQKVLKEIK